MLSLALIGLLREYGLLSFLPKKGYTITLELNFWPYVTFLFFFPFCNGIYLKVVISSIEAFLSVG